MNFLRLLLIISTVSIAYSTNAQVAVGHYFDVDGKLIDGYLEEMDYSPDNQITHNYQSENYERGHYWDRNGNKVGGHLKYHSKKIWYKAFLSKDETKLKPEEVSGMIIGTDSFYVASNFYINKAIGQVFKEERFVRHLAAFDNHCFAVYYDFANNQGIIGNYLIKQEGKPWVTAPDSKEAFKEFAIKYFGNIPIIKDMADKGKIEASGMPMMVKMLEYYYKYKNDQPAFYDRWWNEVRAEELAYHVVKIASVIDTVMTVEYYHDGHKYRSSEVLAVHPDKKEGVTRWFDDEGNVRKEILYKDGKVKEVKTFHSNGQIRYIYAIHKVNVDYNLYQPVFEAVYDEQGTSLLDENGSGVEEFDDAVNSRRITRVYENYRIKSSFYHIEGGKKVVQLTDNQFNFKLKKLKNRLLLYFQEQSVYETVSNNAQGTYLISFVVDANDQYAISYKVLNNVHPDLDSLLNQFLESSVSKNAQYRFKFRPYKIGKSVQTYEVVVPYTFGIIRFYRPPNNYYYDWHLHHMMRQQQMAPINPPAMPGRF
ncbi:hypothetical protein LVD17_23175 [Fulvivirga ulvae]|uniref:hypothetical protein n=1 Tax=Fulvivirga ulvae TaxID=2904245 RepID=UPI001F2A399F|nr:hypothetical protein [Fulvivirga ulvae]UII31198.1 hypothetical protein LVD17_23175 [Fulvivirga ulvae]